MNGEIEGLPLIESPFEIFELRDGESITLIVESWRLGKGLITPRTTGVEKWIKILRVNVPKETKKFFPFYWDITSQTLIAQLLPPLSAPEWAKYKYVVTKYGIPPKARFTLEVMWR